MILQFNKYLNSENEYPLIKIDSQNKIVDISNFTGSNPVYETDNFFYFYSDKIINIDNYEKFKILAKKGDIVSLTAKDNSYMVFPSKKTFSIAFNLKYNDVLNYKYQEVLYNEKPYEVKYVKDKDDKITDGVVFTLKQLCTYISSLIKGYNYKYIIDVINKKPEDDEINKVITKYYDSKLTLKFHKKYELNVKRVGIDENGKWKILEQENITKSNRYLYDYYLIKMFASMIFTKSINDVKLENGEMYRFDRDFKTINEVFDFLNENQDIVNNFFIDTDILFNHPNYMITSYAPHINGVYMFYNYENVKFYLYRSIDKNYFRDKLLMPTYVSTKYRHKIKGIKKIYASEL